MNKREILKEAKRLVAHHGAYGVLDNGMEFFIGSCPSDDPRYPFAEEIVDESYRQAYRVLDFLGV